MVIGNHEIICLICIRCIMYFYFEGAWAWGGRGVGVGEGVPKAGFKSLSCPFKEHVIGHRDDAVMKNSRLCIEQG